MEHLPLVGRGLPQLKTCPEDSSDTTGIGAPEVQNFVSVEDLGSL